MKEAKLCLAAGVVMLLALLHPGISLAQGAFIAAHNEGSGSSLGSGFTADTEINLVNPSPKDSQCADVYAFDNFGNLQFCCSTIVPPNGSTFIFPSDQYDGEGPIEVVATDLRWVTTCDPTNPYATGFLNGFLDVDDLGGVGIPFQKSSLTGSALTYQLNGNSSPPSSGSLGGLCYTAGPLTNCPTEGL